MMPPGQTINQLIRRHFDNAARASFTLSSPLPPYELTLQCVQLAEVRRGIEQAVREAFDAGVVYGQQRAARPIVTVVAHDETQPVPPVRGPYPPPLRPGRKPLGPWQITREG